MVAIYGLWTRLSSIDDKGLLRKSLKSQISYRQSVYLWLVDHTYDCAIKTLCCQ